jgi:SAM-dependent methyltransferase
MIDSVTERVRSLYETFPYPERMPGGASDPYLDMMCAFASCPPPGRISFLDAGCGTGLNLLGGATLYPHCDVYGCDINRVAVADIAEDITEYGLVNAQVKEIELTELPDDFGPAGGFDLMFCTGVLHHLEHPEKALQRLAARLAPQGVLRLMVYSQRGRADLYRFAQTVQKLWPSDAWPFHKRVEMAQALMAQLENHFQTGGNAPPPLRGTWSDAANLAAAEFADRYLHPHDHPYSPGSLRTLVEGAGLRFLDWFEPRDWDFETLLPDLAQGPDAPRDFWDRVEVIDSLFERPKFDIYLVGPEFRVRQVEVGASTLLATSPQLFFEQVSVRGVPLAQAARLRTGGIEPLNRSQGRLLAALGRRFASLEELCAEWDQESPSPALLEEAQDLINKGFLFSPHPPASL